MNHHTLDLISDSRVARVLYMLQGLAMIPRIVLRRVDETFPSLRHSAVSNTMLFCMFCWGRYLTKRTEHSSFKILDVNSKVGH